MAAAVAALSRAVQEVGILHEDNRPGLVDKQSGARAHAGGLTSDAILKKVAAIQMIDVHLPTTDGRHIVLSRHTEPERDLALLLAQLGLDLPAQPPPRVYASGQIVRPRAKAAGPADQARV